jgi:PAS domain S-box-containing protein
MNALTPSANPPVEILIAEDSPTQAQRLLHILNQRGYRVTHAANGRLAFEAAQRHKPTIIISDVVMPEMDGYELCRRVKADASLSDIPLILVTTLSDPEDVIRGLECRADNFILKPYDEDYLLGRVQFVLLNRKVLQTERTTTGVEIFFNDQRHFITADRLQILNLLLSTYDAAIQRTKELIHAQEALHGFNRSLGEANLRLEQEIGERKKAEQALRSSEENLAVTLQSIGDAVLATDAAGLVTRINAVAEALTGWTQAEATGRPVEEIFHIINGENRQPALIPVADTLAKGSIHGLANHTVLIARDGTERPIADSCAPIRSREGAVIGAVLVFRDVTEQQRASAEVARNIKTLAEFKAALDEHAIVAITDSRGKITYVNDKFCAISKYAREELIGQDHRIVNSGHHPKAFIRELWETITSGRVWKGEIKNHAKDGSFYWVDTTIVPFLGDDGKPIQFIAIRADISEHKQAEDDLRASEDRLQELNKNLERLVTERTDELHESEERFRQLAEQSSEVFWFLGLNPERFLYISPAAETVWGLPVTRFYQDVRAWWTAIHTKDQAHVHAAWETFVKGDAPRFEEEFRVIKSDGSVRWVQINGVPIRNQTGEIIRLSGIVRDITERRKIHDQMLRAQRLEGIGTLAGGVAHDLNNALAPILMATELLRMQYPDATQMIDTVEASAKRGADMVRQLLTFAKGVEGARLLLQSQQLIQEMKKVIEGTFPKNIELRIKHVNKAQAILGDVTQLHQVLLNLCVNARDAMPNGGRLTLETENTEIDVTYASTVPEAKPGHYIVWRVADTGTGIPPEILQRIFEPFFSTKGPDKGTGLGLSTVIGIVKSHGGFVQVHSTLGQGTTFAVYLPAAGESTPPAQVASAMIDMFRGNGEAILVVDDEAAVRQVTRAVLTALNFTVFTAVDGTDALIQAAEKRTELRAVITDAQMPHMDGLSFVRVLKRMLPAAGIIVASGHLEEREVNEFKELGVSALLDKPFTQEMLVAVLKTIFKK